MEMTEPAVVYRLFDGGGRLLYVGCTQELDRRLDTHRKSRPWAGAIVRTEVQHYATRAEALTAEEDAITHERPMHNHLSRGGPGVTPLRKFRVDDALWEEAQAAAAHRGETVTQLIRRALREYVRSAQ